jgi:outer membrane protein insertion porin family
MQGKSAKKIKNMSKNKRTSKVVITLSAVGLAAFMHTQVYAQSFSDIKVEGLKRVEIATVFGYLPFRPGETLSPESTDQAIKSLFNTGFFKDVKIKQNGTTLLIEVEERPVIMQLDFLGVTQLSKDALKQSLRGVNLNEGRFYDPSLIEKAEQSLKQQYISRGYYGVDVKAVSTPMSDNRMAVVFEVKEGVPSTIKKINFTGNNEYSENTLLDEMRLSAATWFSWYTNSNKFAKDKLNEDLQSLRQFYLNRGYLNFSIENVQTSLSDNKKEMYIDISIKEGQKYTIGNVTVSGNLLDKEADIKKLLKMESGKTFTIDKVTQTNQAIASALAKYGYAFASIQPQTIQRPDAKNPTVDLNFSIDLGQRTYVRNINIQGNDKTRDEVVRREMRQLENAWFDQEKVALSQARINRLGYFTDVEMNTAPVQDAPDKVDINVNVREKPTGQFNIGAGYSSTDKLVLQTSVRQDNVLGTGTSLGLDINTAKSGRTFAITQVDPYFTLDGISRYTDVYHRTTRPLYSSGDEDFKIKTTGGSLKFGVPFSEYDTIYFGLGFDHTKLFLTPNSPESYKRFAGYDPLNAASGFKYIDPITKKPVKGFGLSSNNVPITIGWGKDSRDSALVPNKGRYQQAYIEVGTPITDSKYYKLTYQHQYYYPIGRNFTVAVNTDLGYGKGYGGQPYPVFKNFFAGGIGSVRGYDNGTLGPKDITSDGRQQAAGGATKIVNNIEMIVPLPGTGIDRTLRLYTFLDSGMVYREGARIRFKDKKDADGNITESGMRFSYGFGLSWISPIGPLKLGLGFPLGKKHSNDQLQKFQFQVGTSF